MPSARRDAKSHRATPRKPTRRPGAGAPPFGLHILYWGVRCAQFKIHIPQRATSPVARFAGGEWRYSTNYSVSALPAPIIDMGDIPPQLCESGRSRARFGHMGAPYDPGAISVIALRFYMDRALRWGGDVVGWRWGWYIDNPRNSARLLRFIAFLQRRFCRRVRFCGSLLSLCRSTIPPIRARGVVVT